MNDLNEFIAIQEEILKLKNKSSLYIENQLPEFKKYFYYTVDAGAYNVDGDQMDTHIRFTFLIPELNEQKNLITQLSLTWSSVFVKTQNTIQDNNFEIGIKKEEVSSFDNFFMVNQSELKSEIMTHVIYNYSKNIPNAFSLEVKGLFLEKRESSKLLFTDFLLNSNKELIQPFFQNELKDKWKLDIGDMNLKKIIDSFNNSFNELMCSLYSKSDMGLKMDMLLKNDTTKFDELLLVINQHDTKKRFVDLNQNLPDNKISTLNKKI